MGAPAIVIASANHGDVLAEAFGRYEREYDVRLVHDEVTAKHTAKDLMASGHQVALFVIDSDHDQEKLYGLIGGTRQAVPTAAGSSCCSARRRSAAGCPTRCCVTSAASC